MAEPIYPTLSSELIHSIVNVYHSDPFSVLGMHYLQLPAYSGVVIRTFQPNAKSVTIISKHGEQIMERVQEDGFFESVFSQTEFFPYQFSIVPFEGITYLTDDPYRFLPVLSEYDLYLAGEGTHTKLYTKLGAHPITHQGVEGVTFAVWAPNAERVSVIGDFNVWDGRRHPMRLRGTTGVWELFIPGLVQGDSYKYEVKSRHLGFMAEKSDPYGFSAEVRPSNASRVWDLNKYHWNDGDWMLNRHKHQHLNAPISVYEVHLGSWRRSADGEFLTYREMADELVPYVKQLGFTHLELMPITEHPFDGSWGYQVVGYFAPTSRFGSPDDFMYFIDQCHQAGLGVIVDWVPAHFPKDGHGLAFFDGTHLYEHEDPRLGEHQDWGTFIFNFGRTEVCEFLLNSALFWFDKYHIDGIRVDAVASMIYLDYSRKEGQWVPNRYGGRENLEAIAFLKRFNELAHLEFPDVLTFAEESTAWQGVSRPTYLGGLGFDMKWNMGWMHDILEYMTKDPIYRRYHHGTLTFSLLYAFTENFILPFSHDEVVHGKGSMLSKMPGDYWQRFANLRSLYAFMYAHPGKKLLFMGCEFGQWNEWNSYSQLDWNLLDFDNHRNLQQFIKDVNVVYRSEPALHEVDFSWEGFEWVDLHDVDHSIVSFLRRGQNPNDYILVVVNFTPVPRFGYRVGVPGGGYHRELLNSDAGYYGGSNIGNQGGLVAEDQAWQKHPHSLLLTLPPLGVVMFKPDQRL
jgi:1,4-alpha-glucan branching enzyme